MSFYNFNLRSLQYCQDEPFSNISLLLGNGLDITEMDFFFVRGFNMIITTIYLGIHNTCILVLIVISMPVQQRVIKRVDI